MTPGKDGFECTHHTWLIASPDTIKSQVLSCGLSTPRPPSTGRLVSKNKKKHTPVSRHDVTPATTALHPLGTHLDVRSRRPKHSHLRMNHDMHVDLYRSVGETTREAGGGKDSGSVGLPEAGWTLDGEMSVPSPLSFHQCIRTPSGLVSSSNNTAASGRTATRGLLCRCRFFLGWINMRQVVNLRIPVVRHFPRRKAPRVAFQSQCCPPGRLELLWCGRRPARARSWRETAQRRTRARLRRPERAQRRRYNRHPRRRGNGFK